MQIMCALSIHQVSCDYQELTCSEDHTNEVKSKSMQQEQVEALPLSRKRELSSVSFFSDAMDGGLHLFSVFMNLLRVIFLLV